MFIVLPHFVLEEIMRKTIFLEVILLFFYKCDKFHVQELFGRAVHTNPMQPNSEKTIPSHCELATLEKIDRKICIKETLHYYRFELFPA